MSDGRHWQSLLLLQDLDALGPKGGSSHDRAAIAALLPADALAQYERMRARRAKPPWVVRLRGEHCPVCNLRLPTSLVQRARQWKQLATCPHCCRIVICQGKTSSKSLDGAE